MAIAIMPGLAQQKPFDFREPLRLNLFSGNSGNATLTLANTKLRRGEQYHAQYMFQNTRGSYWVYNPFFLRLVPLPGQLAIYDSEKRYIGDLIAFIQGSRTRVGTDNFILLREGNSVGAKIDFRAGFVPLKYVSGGTLLPPGKYHVQLILYGVFVNSSPGRVSWDDANFDKSEALRSNSVAIEIVE